MNDEVVNKLNAVVTKFLADEGLKLQSIMTTFAPEKACVSIQLVADEVDDKDRKLVD